MTSEDRARYRLMRDLPEFHDLLAKVLTAEQKARDFLEKICSSESVERYDARLKESAQCLCERTGILPDGDLCQCPMGDLIRHYFPTKELSHERTKA